MNKIFHLILLRSIILIICFSFICFIAYYITLYMYPFVISFLIASFLQPVILFLEQSYNIKRKLAGNLLILLITFFSMSFIFVLLYQTVTETFHLIMLLPQNYQMIDEFLVQFGQTNLIPIYEELQTIIPFLPDFSFDILKSIIPFITDKLYESSNLILTKFISSFSFMITSVSDLTIIIIVIFISTYFMTKDFELLKSILQKGIPNSIRYEYQSFIFYCKQSVVGLVKTHLILALISSVISYIGFLFFGINHAITVSIIVLFIDLIPYIGIGFLFIPWIGFLFITGDYITTIQLASLYIIIIIIRQMVEPKLIAIHLQIHPLIILFILFITFQHFGILSLLITPILLIILSALYQANVFSLLKSFVLTEK